MDDLIFSDLVDNDTYFDPVLENKMRSYHFSSQEYAAKN